MHRQEDLTFSWYESVPLATTYELQLSTDPGFSGGTVHLWLGLSTTSSVRRMASGLRLSEGSAITTLRVLFKGTEIRPTSTGRSDPQITSSRIVPIRLWRIVALPRQPIRINVASFSIAAWIMPWAADSSTRRINWISISGSLRVSVTWFSSSFCLSSCSTRPWDSRATCSAISRPSCERASNAPSPTRCCWVCGLTIGTRIRLKRGSASGVSLWLVSFFAKCCTIIGEEIEVSKLIGGTDAFIRRPFLYTGLWYGLLGAVAAWIVVTLGFWLIDAPARRLAGLYDSSFLLSGLSWSGTGLLLLTGIGLGLAGSWLAVGRHLNAIEPS